MKKMKTSILFAAVMAALIFGAYSALLLTASEAGGKESQGSRAVEDGDFIPPLEWINQQREQKLQENYHTKSDPPKVKIFQTLYKGGTQITFNHEEHAETYGISCIECHHVERCSKCHVRDEVRQMAVVEGKQAMHENCMGCHADLGGPQACGDCHIQ